MEREVSWVLGLLEEAFDGPAWHGSSLLSAVRGVDVERAAWRPSPSRRCVWEVVLHCAYWKHRVRRRLAPDSEAAFPRRGSDWPRLPATLDAAAWLADVALLECEHRRLRGVVEAFPAEALAAPAPAHRRPAVEHMRGIAFHDVYHTGQIRWLLRQWEEEGERERPARRLTVR